MWPSPSFVKNIQFLALRAATGRNWPAGQKPQKSPLSAGNDVTIEIDVEFNRNRRASFQVSATIQNETNEQIKAVQRPEKHELAARIQDAFESAKPGDDGRISIHRHTTPHITASPGAAERIVTFVSMLAYSLAAKGIKFASGKTENEPLRFIRGEDIVHLFIEEAVENYEITPTIEQKRQPSWTWNNRRTRPSGQLTFRLTSPSRVSGRCKWTESGSSEAIDLLPKIVTRIEDLFTGWENAREEAKRREQYWEEQKKRQAEREVTERHEQKIKEVKLTRRTSLLRASMWFQTYRELLDFVEACETYWSKSGDISDQQRKWLEWARSEAELYIPLSFKYPSPEKDGPFDETSIPLGGPYPEAREMPLPKLLEEIKHLIGDQRSPYRGYGW